MTNLQDDIVFNKHSGIMRSASEMQNDVVTVEFIISGSRSDSSSSLTFPLQEGEDWCCVLNIPGLVNQQKFYGTSYMEAILNTVNFVTILLADPPLKLLKQLDADLADSLSVEYKVDLAD